MEEIDYVKKNCVFSGIWSLSQGGFKARNRQKGCLDFFGGVFWKRGKVEEMDV